MKETTKIMLRNHAKADQRDASDERSVSAVERLVSVIELSKIYAPLQNKQQIEELETHKLKNGIRFFFALFFKNNASREFLLEKGIYVVYIQNNVIHCGNKECLPPDWIKVTYDEFKKLIAH